MKTKFLCSINALNTILVKKNTQLTLWPEKFVSMKINNNLYLISKNSISNFKTENFLND